MPEGGETLLFRTSERTILGTEKGVAMPRELPIIEARKLLTTLPEELARHPETGAIAVTRHGKPVLAIMGWDLFETIMETLEVMGDPTLMAQLRQSIQEADVGQTRPWSAVKEELGL
jgi:antitoxin YefM